MGQSKLCPASSVTGVENLDTLGSRKGKTDTPYLEGFLVWLDAALSAVPPCTLAGALDLAGWASWALVRVMLESFSGPHACEGEDSAATPSNKTVETKDALLMPMMNSLLSSLS